ncbi:MAG: hypothetical protein IJF87_08765 [Erysipelotrichaceae bacterium]|nr:hypothetical protein [Erysipelotrichaceae bacterium]
MSRIRLTNNVKLESIAFGMDTTDVLASTALNIQSMSDYTYTATKNCIVFLGRRGFNGSVKIAIDNTEISGYTLGEETQTTYKDSVAFPLSYGQTLKLSKNGTGERRAYVDVFIYGAK